MVYLDLLKVLGQSSKFMYFPVSAFLFKVRLDLWDYIYIYTCNTYRVDASEIPQSLQKVCIESESIINSE